MEQITNLKNLLKKIDRKGYKAYKDIKNIYEAMDYTLYIDHVQGDPFALPSRIRVRVKQDKAKFPENIFANKSREIAARDFLTRLFIKAIKKHSKGNRGSGKSGIITIDKPGQEILERTSMHINNDYVEARFLMALPAFGRKIAGDIASDMFFKELPQIIKDSLFYTNINQSDLTLHIETSEDADHLRAQLDKSNLIAFVADESILPRKSGIDSRPLKSGTIIPFKSPESMKVEFNLPNKGEIYGMGIKKGITLIVGGGYHGKSTLLNAIELGIYNHIPGDGREFVVTNMDAVKIRAEDGRSIQKTCITPFISNLPFEQETDSFSTENASGSTSQAANIIESLELGCKAILIDEDTSATNFMIRDHRMQELVTKKHEPITPFIDKVKQLYNDYQVSTLLVIGGSGDYFDIADTTICMVEYKPVEVTKKAMEIAEKYRAERKKEGGENFGKIINRHPISKSFDASRGQRDVKISPMGLQSISFGNHTINLGSIEQLVDLSQTRAIGDAIYYATKFMDDKKNLKEIVHHVLDQINEKSLDVLSPYPVGNYASFRSFELASAINRLRTLRVKQ